MRKPRKGMRCGERYILERRLLDALCLTTTELRNFLQPVKEQSNSRCLRCMVYTNLAIYIHAWASALLVSTGWAMRRPCSSETSNR